MKNVIMGIEEFIKYEEETMKYLTVLKRCAIPVVSAYCTYFP